MHTNDQQHPTHCVTCGHPLGGKFCSQCGEKVLKPEDKKITHFFEEVFHIITHADSKFFRSLKYMVTKPGFLTKEYLIGRRKLYTGVLSLFFIGNLIYLLVSPIDMLNSKYVSQMYGQSDFYTASIKGVAEKKKLEKGWKEKELAEHYDHKSATVSKFMMVLLILLFSIPAWLLFYSKQGYYFDYIVFATEFVNFLMYVVLLALPYLLWGILILVWKLGVKFEPDINSTPAVLLLAGIIWGYLYLAAKRVFGQPWTAPRTLLLTFSLLFVVLAYRFLLFHITMATL